MTETNGAPEGAEQAPQGPGADAQPPAPQAVRTPEPPADKSKRRRGGVTGPLILITVGVILLLNNLGMLPWSVWSSLVRFWPIILVLIGIDVLVGRRSLVRSVIGALVSILVIGLVVVLATTPFSSTTELVSERWVQPSEGASRAVVSLSPGVDQLTVRGAASPGMLLEADVRRPSWARVTKEYRSVDGVARYEIKSAGLEGRAPLLGAPGIGGEWDVKLDPSIPMELNVDAGVGQCEIDLTGLSVDTFDVHSGVGQTDVTLPETGRITGKIESGVGQTRVFIPRDMNARVRVDTGLGSVNVPDGYTRQGDVYVSPSTGSTSTAELLINGGLGAIDVEVAP